MTNNFVSGEWSGFYVERHRQERGWMHLYLQFADGKIKGKGTDYIGPWVAHGSYDDTTGNCQWTKQNVGKHTVDYNGQCGENGIQGNWTIFSTGAFHIWPRNHPHFNELYLRQELESAGGNGRPIPPKGVSDGELA